MLLVPTSTDAPLYHRPIATVGLIAINFIAWAVAALRSTNDYWMLLIHVTRPETAAGSGWSPLMWFVSPFVHSSFVPMAINMIFLWTFGMVVEGKLGLWKFLLVYLGLGTLLSAIEQVLFGGYWMLGAAGSVSVLMGMALVWAPKNEMTCTWAYMNLNYQTRTIDVPIINLCGLYWIVDLCLVLFLSRGFNIGATHLLGAALGFAVGVVLLRAKIVDCEDWDLFSVWSGKEGREIQEERAARRDKEIELAKVAKSDQARVQAAEMVEFFLKNNNLDQALAALVKTDTPARNFPLSAGVWRELIAQLDAAGRYSESVPYLVALLEQHPAGSEKARLKLAEVLLDHEHRPHKAIEVLAPLARSETPALIAAHRDAILEQAHAVAANEDAEVELDVEL